MQHKIIIFVVALSLCAFGIFMLTKNHAEAPLIGCTLEAKICPDGTSVGRTGPQCSFAPCPVGTPVSDDRIHIESPLPGSEIASPFTVTGKARGTWFFEGSFPITIVNWDGLIIGEGYATADGEWMTTEFVPFTGTITYTIPEGTPYDRGTIIFRKDNPSGLPEHDDAREVPIIFNELQN